MLISFITPNLLQTEYDYGWIPNSDSLKPYINMGYINNNQFIQIINHQPVNN